MSAASHFAAKQYKLLHSLSVASELMAKAARSDPAAFAEYIMRDERSGRRIKLAPMQRAWQHLASKHDRLIVWAHVESGKTQGMAISRMLWEIGRDPSLRCCILSNTHHQAVKVLSSVSRYIEQSQDLRRVFRNLRKGDPWTASSITVDRATISKDPTIQATGVHGNILGSRLDLVIVDDILDYENTLTPHARQALWDWFNATVMGRLTAKARVIVIGNAHHPDDLMHRFGQQGWQAYRYPVMDDRGIPRWPERWPQERIERARTSMPPLEFSRQLMCVARDEASARFKRTWIEACMVKGEGRRPTPFLERIPPGFKIYTGVDLAVQQHAAADLTVLFTIAVHPDGKREPIWIESGRWAGPEIVQRIFDTHKRYQSIIIVENNAAQDFIVQFAQHRHSLPIRPFTTGRNKAHPEFGVESLATEMSAGAWIIPNVGGRCEPEFEAWIQEMQHYDPRAHTGDRLMASWFAREGIRMGEVVAESGVVDLRR